MATRKLPVDAQAAIEMCELCQREEANFFCKDCQQEMCGLCKTSHLRSKPCRNHKVINIHGHNDEDDGDWIPIKCSSHPREIIQMFCFDCEVPVCLTCIADKKHKNHRFETLQNILVNYRREISQSISETKEQISELEASLQSIDINVQDYTKRSDKSIEGINKQRKQIKSQVDTIADRLIHTVEKQKLQDLQLMEKERKEVQKMISDQNKYLQSCEEKLKSMNVSKLDFSTDIRHQMKISTTSDLLYITKLNPPMFVSIATPDLQEVFGKVMDPRGKRSTQKVSEDRDTKGKKSTTFEDKADGTSVRISTDIIARFTPDLDSWHVSAVNDKEVWCGNNVLSLTGIDGQVKKEIELDYYSFDIAVTPSGELLVTENEGTNIKKYLPDGHCITISDTKPYRARGLCITSQQDILLCMYNATGDNKVVRMTSAGEIKQTIQTDKHHQPLLTDPRYVQENINGDVCIVDDNTIVVVNKEGVMRFRYPESGQSPHIISGCYGIACDMLGFILICDYQTSRIHQIDKDGRFIRFVLTEQHGIEGPRGLSIDNQGQLWVADHHEDCYLTTISVFKYRS